MGTRLPMTEERKVLWPLLLRPVEPPDAAGACGTVLAWGLAAQVFLSVEWHLNNGIIWLQPS